jgi:aspartate/methionine/tyrosine aminotransferase
MFSPRFSRLAGRLTDAENDGWAIHERARVLFLNTPGNRTGSIIPRHQLAA